MKILVVPRKYIETCIEKDAAKGVDFASKAKFISIFSTEGCSDKCFSPLPDRSNILKLQFDDMEDSDEEMIAVKRFNLILFNEDHAKAIKKFAEDIKNVKLLFVHCDAGISRSGAVGFCLNQFFNLNKNENDFEQFFKDNPNIIPNNLVKRILNKELFGETDWSSIFNEKLDKKLSGNIDFSDMFI